RIAALEKAVAELKSGGGAAADPSTIRVYWDKGIKLKSNDGTFVANIGGRLQWDMYFATLDDKMKQFIGDTAAASAVPWSGQMDQTKFRRARFEMGGSAYDRFLFKLEIDFAGGAVQIRDAFMGVDKIMLGESSNKFLVGSFKEPTMMEELTSDLHLTFLERSMINVFAPDYSTGFGFFGSGVKDDSKADRMTWALCFVRDVGGSGDDTGSLKSGKYNFSLRVTGLPYYENKGEQLIHIGGWFSQRNPNNFGAFALGQAPQVQTYAQRPDTSFGATLVTTGARPTDSITMYGVELAGVFSQFWFHGEYAGVNMAKSKRAGNKAASVGGYFVQAGFFLTGEKRSYKNSTGTWDRISPKQNAFSTDKDGNVGLGAIELAARYDFLSLEDTHALLFGGKLSTITVGANWYLAPNFRFMLDYINVQLDKKNASGPKSKGSENILTTRFQCDW
ncbi:MAG TPA: porin, partial [Planctomycetota bacterium]|nr:porin [Planctomycetota bacterium]